MSVVIATASGNLNKTIFGAFISGQYYDFGLSATILGTKSMVANELSIAPLITNEDLTIDRIGTIVSTFGVTTTCRIVIYDSDSAGVPRDKVYESAEISTSLSNGFKEVTNSFTFIKDTVYWVGLISSGACTFNAFPSASCYNLGSPNQTQVYCSVRTILASYVAPTPLFPTSGNFSNGRTPFLPPVIIVRKA